MKHTPNCICSRCAYVRQRDSYVAKQREAQERLFSAMTYAENGIAQLKRAAGRLHRLPIGTKSNGKRAQRASVPVLEWMPMVQRVSHGSWGRVRTHVAGSRASEMRVRTS